MTSKPTQSSLLSRLSHRIFFFGIVDPDNIELRGKIILLNIMTVLALVAILPFGILRMFQGAYLVGGAELLTVVLFMGMSVYRLKTNDFKYTRIAGLAMTIVFLGYLTITTGYQNTGFLWSYCLPPVCLFLLDRNRGSLLLSVYLIVVVACLFMPGFPAFYNYSITIKTSYPISFAVVWVIAYYFEYIMSTLQKETIQKNEKLQRTVGELRETRDQLYQSQKMEAIGRLAGGVAHDFNNILTGISGYADLLKQKFGTIDPHIDHYAGSIMSSSKRAADLTSKLLAYARKGKIEMAIVSFHQIVEDVVDILKHSMNKNIEIRQELTATSATVMGDRNQLQNALTNLALNAVDAMPQGGTLTFFTEIIDLSEATLNFPSYMVTPGRYLKFMLSDTGYGIDEAMIERVMEPFFTTKQKGKGTGLGLPSVYGTVKSHHGYFGLKSTVGKGTVAEIYLPLTRQVEQKSSEFPQEFPKGHGTILLVDDEETVREVAGEMVSLLGYSLVVRSDGREALEYYKGNFQKIDLVILDIVMPHLGGYDTFIAMKAVNPALKAIACSGYVINNEVRKMLDNGARGFLQKPFDIKSLSAGIRKALA